MDPNYDFVRDCRQFERAQGPGPGIAILHERLSNFGGANHVGARNCDSVRDSCQFQRIRGLSVLSTAIRDPGMLILRKTLENSKRPWVQGQE